MDPLVRLPESVVEVPVIAPPTDTAPLRVAVPDTVRVPETVAEFMVVRGADTVRLSYTRLFLQTQ